MSARKSIWRRLFKWSLVLGVTGVVVASIALIVIYFKLSPNLPSIESLNNVQFQVPLRVFTRDGQLISEFGEKRREPIRINEVPDTLKHAFLAAEDDRFYEHPGVDYQGILRAVINLIRTGERGQGGSTITMQVARNFFLSNKKTYERKLNEILLALRIESELSKDKILELYLNKIYLGNRAYGIGAASHVYYGKDVSRLTLAESAMIAGLPKAPSRYNPIINPQRATLRRDYVLRRMFELGYISVDEYRETMALPSTASLHYARPEVEADYVAEMVRSRLQGLYGDRVYTAGLNVYTTLKSANQSAANASLRKALIDYEKRHGFTGPIGRIDVAATMDADAKDSAATDQPAEEPVPATNESVPGLTLVSEKGPKYASLLNQLSAFSQYGGLKAAVVLNIEKAAAHVLLSDGSEADIRLADSEWAKERQGKDRLGPKIEALTDVLHIGDVVYTEETELPGHVLLSQLPGVEGALVSLQPKTGAILALVGGFDFHRSKFNRVTQARRQPGSNFKPFIYSAALENGDTAATIYNDAPVVFHDSALEGEWRPENYSGRFYGPTRLREALVKSRNLVSIRVLRGLGLRKSLDYVERFGFDIAKLPADLSLALGSGSVTPLQLVNGYGVFANQGYLTAPHFIDRIVDASGETVFTAPEVVLCDRVCEEESAAESDPQEEALDVGVVVENEQHLAGKQVAVAAVAVPQPELDEDPESMPPIEKVEKGIVKAPSVIDERNAYIMANILREVISRGTGRKALVLNRKDIAGKTGTTNDQHDAWFSGFNSEVATSVWVGYDELEPLGAKETGGEAALPMWIDYMAVALKDIPEDIFIQPARMVTVRIDRKTGELTNGQNPQSMFEIFPVERAPSNMLTSTSSNNKRKKGSQGSGSVRQPASEPQEQLF